MKKSFYLSLAIAAFILCNLQAVAQFQYLFPVDGSKNHFPNTHIIVRNGELMDAASVTTDKIILTGTQSGVIDANVVLSTDGKTVCITPVTPFAHSETIIVKVNDGLKTISGQTLAGTTFQFSIRREMTEQEQQELQEYLNTHDEEGNLISDLNQQSTYVPYESSERTTTFDFIDLYTNNNPAPGRIFFHRNHISDPEGYGIMESNADSVFYRASAIDGSNFRLNHNGYLTAYRLDPGVDSAVIVLDSTYNIIDTVHCQNGLSASQHEHLFFPDGTKWFTIYDWQQGWDLSPWGGGTAAVNVSWIQELDANENVIFQWRSDDYFAINDATSDIMLTISASFFDPWHINSMYLDADDNLIVSWRNMDRVTKINPANGNILWQWGGPFSTYNEFTTTGDPNGGFSHQHHVQRIDNGHILLFDNGNLHSVQLSKPKEYVIDEVNKTANCIWYYSHPQVNNFNMYTTNQGSVMRMENGNTIIGYGRPSVLGLPNGTEIDANENIVWEYRFSDSSEYTYRLYKFDWNPPVGIDELDISTNITVFPNPSDGILFMNMNIPYSGMATVEVLNFLGQTVYAREEKMQYGDQSISLDLSNLNAGIYFLRGTAGDMKWVKQVVIQ